LTKASRESAACLRRPLTIVHAQACMMASRGSIATFGPVRDQPAEL
jgi:hypothetical protein